MAKKIESPPLMFGAYVESVSASMSWNGQGGSCQMTLVEDEKNGIKIELPPVGIACYFRYHGFYYSGIFQRWSYREEINGKKYDIIIESPGSKIFEGVSVILSGFEGTEFNEGDGYDKFNPSGNPNFTNDNITNVWNPYGEKENYAFGGRFGAARTNSAGFLARDLLRSLEELSLGKSPFGSKITFGESEYEFDAGDLKNVPEHFRIGGQTATLGSIIQECSEILQFDYFADLESRTGTSQEDGGFIIQDPIIKIKTIDRTKQPSPGAVKNLVDESQRSGVLVSSDIGQEFPDEVSQRVIIGGPASRYWMTSIDSCVPVWGKLGPKNYLVASGYNTVPYAYQMGASVPIILDETAEFGGSAAAEILSGYFGSTYWATVAEIRMALGGMEAWLAFKVFESFSRGTYEVDPWVAGVEVTPEILRLLADGRVGALSLAATSFVGAKKSYDPVIQEYIKKIFDRVQKTANEYYGRMFLVPLPYEPGGLSNNLKFVEEDLVEVASWDIASDAWVSNKPVNDINFYNSGRLKSVSVYPFTVNRDFSEMGSDYAAFLNQPRPGSPGISGICTSKTGFQDPNVFFLPNIAPNPFIVADTGLQVKIFDANTTLDAAITFLSSYFFNIYIDPKYYLTPGKSSSASLPVHPAIDYPDWIGVPQQSIRYSWGPWYNSGNRKGRSEVSVDTNLVPENFGSVQTMNDAGREAAGAGIKNLEANESGRVELADYPRFNIAEQFNGSGPYITGMNISIGVGGFTTSYEFNTWTPNFGKLSKFNADRISRIYKATLEALKRFAENSTNVPFKPIQLSKYGYWGEMADRQKSARDSAEFSLFRGFQNSYQGSQIRTADALGLALGDLFNSFGCSEDQKWSPVASKSQKQGQDSGVYLQLPLAIAEEEGGQFSHGVFPCSEDLDPYFSKSIDDINVKTDFTAVINTDADGETKDININKAKTKSNIQEVRSVGLRGPMLLSGWGYDVANNPVPSADGDITRFHEDPTNRANWKTGPLHLMWDEERKIWSGGIEIISGVLASDITSPSSTSEPTTFTINAFRKTAQGKGAGSQELSSEVITCYNRDTSLEQEAGDVFVIVGRINYEWVPLWVGCP